MICVYLGVERTRSKRKISYSVLHVDRLRKYPEKISGLKSSQTCITRGMFYVDHVYC